MVVKKRYILILLLFLIGCVYAQSDSAMLYIYKPKDSGLGKASISLNNQYVGELKTGQLIACKLYSEGRYTISLSNTGANENGIPRGLTFTIRKGFNYYVKLYTNVSYRMLLQKENHYTGQQHIDNPALFSRKKSTIIFVEDTNNPLTTPTVLEYPVQISVDENLPTINITSPNLTIKDTVEETSKSTFLIQGNVTQYNKIDHLKINGQLVSLSSSGSFSYNLPLPNEGDNIISVTIFTGDHYFEEKEFIIVRKIPTDEKIVLEKELEPGVKVIKKDGVYFIIIEK